VRPRRIAVVVVVLAALAAAAAIADQTVSVGSGRRFSTPLPLGVLGAIFGTEYAALGAALVLIFRRTGVINFALPGTGLLAAELVGWLSSAHHTSYWSAVALAVAAAALVSAALGQAINLRYRDAQAIHGTGVTLVTTIALAAAFGFIASHLSAGIFQYPSPPGFPSFHIDSLVVTGSFSAILFLALPALVAVCAVDRFAPLRLAVPANWAAVGALAGLLMTFDFSTRGYADGSAVEPTIRILAVAAVAGFESVPLAVVAGMSFGVAEQYVLWNWPLRSATLWQTGALLVLAGLAWGIRTQPPTFGIERLQPQLGRVLPAFVVLGIGGAAATSQTGRGSQVLIAGTIGFVLLAASFTAFGQDWRINLAVPAFALAGVVAAHEVLGVSSNALVAIACAAAAGGVSGLTVERVALRLSGWNYVVTTLGVTVLGSALFGQLVANGFERRRMTLFGLSVAELPGQAWLVFGLAAFAILLAILILQFTSVRMTHALVGGALAGLGGFSYYTILSAFGVTTLPLSTAVTVAVIAIVGGSRTPVGAVLGTLLILALPTFVVSMTLLEYLGVAVSVLILSVVTPNGLARPILAARPDSGDLAQPVE